jgi:hypothetical protein
MGICDNLLPMLAIHAGFQRGDGGGINCPSVNECYVAPLELEFIIGFGSTTMSRRWRWKSEVSSFQCSVFSGEKNRRPSAISGVVVLHPCRGAVEV